MTEPCDGSNCDSKLWVFQTDLLESVQDGRLSSEETYGRVQAAFTEPSRR